MAARLDFRSLRPARGSAAPKIIIAVVVLAALAGGGWYFFLRQPPTVIPEVAPAPTPADPAAGTEAAAVTPDPAALNKLNQLTVDQLFKEARTALNEQRLVSPPGNNALEFYLKILEREPGNSGAQDALRELFTFAASAAEQDINARNIDNANLLVIADTDVLTDRLWVRSQDMLGQTIVTPWADNGALINNAVDTFAGSSALISVRSRGRFQRSFDVVDAIRRDADAQLRDHEQQLNARLQETEGKLAQLQQQKSESGKLMLSPEQTQAIEQFSCLGLGGVTVLLRDHDLEFTETHAVFVAQLVPESQ